MIPFHKASAYGNDFLIIEAETCAEDRHAITVKLCDRTRGVGADGVEWIAPGGPGQADVTATLINADGSDAEISGNGTRCVAAYIASQDPGKRRIRINTGAGVKTCELAAISGNSYTFAMRMGAVREQRTSSILLEDGMQVEGTYVDLGNPHFVINIGSLPDDWREIARRVQALRSEFPHGVNVEFVAVHSRQHIRSWFYERGAGETHSSGTGSCASAAACHFGGWIDSTVDVESPGGTQTVEFLGDGLLLRGSAELICRGEAWC